MIPVPGLLFLCLALALPGASGLVQAADPAPAAVGGETSPDTRPEKVWRLSYRIPNGWTADRERAKKLDLTAVLLPQGGAVGGSNPVISVAFERKNPMLPWLADLEGYFKAEMMKVLTVFPDVESDRWKPSSLDPDKIRFASLEIFSRDGGPPPPRRVVMIDAGDGFYSIDLAAGTREELDRPDVTAFFESLLLISSR